MEQKLSRNCEEGFGSVQGSHRRKARTKRKKHDERSASAFSKKEEEDQARGLIEVIQRNLDEAQTRSYEVEHKLGRVLGST